MAVTTIPIGGSPPAGPPAIPHDALVQQKQGQAIMIWAIGAFCIFGWEFLLCLPKEYKVIWKRPMNFSSALYLANRYFGVLQLCFVVSLESNVWSPGPCSHVYYFEPVGALISTILSQSILGSRVYAIYMQNKIIGFILVTTLIAEIIVGGLSISTTSSLPFTGPSTARPPCGALTGPPGWLISFWTIPLFYDALAFLLTAWKAFDFWRRDYNTHIFDIIWRDGILYFFAIFSMNAVNVIIFTTVSRTLQPVNLTPTLVLEIVLSCRLVLNLRDTYQPVSKTNQPRWNDSTKVNSGSDPSKESSSDGVVRITRHVEQASAIDLKPLQKVYGSHDLEAEADFKAPAKGTWNKA